MLQKTVGMVLRTVKYKDTAMIADVYTADLGRVSLQVSVPRTRKASVRPSFFQPMALVDLELELRPRSSVHKVHEVKLAHPYVSIPYDPVKSSIVLFLSEFLSRALREEQENPRLFAYLQHSVLWLDACTQSYANFHLVFLVRLSRFLGLYPNLDDYVPGAYFDLQGACFTLLPPSHSYYLGREDSARLVQFMRMNYETMHLFEMSRAERSRCLTLLNDYYRLHLPDFPVLRSLQVLRELFD